MNTWTSPWEVSACVNVEFRNWMEVRDVGEKESGEQAKRSACFRTAVGTLGRLARFHDASPGAGDHQGQRDSRLLSQHSARGYDRGSARLSRSLPHHPSPLPPRRATWLSFHSDFGSFSFTLSLFLSLSLPPASSASFSPSTWPAQAKHPTQPPSLLHPLPRTPTDCRAFLLSFPPTCSCHVYCVHGHGVHECDIQTNMI